MCSYLFVDGVNPLPAEQFECSGQDVYAATGEHVKRHVAVELLDTPAHLQVA